MNSIDFFDHGWQLGENAPCLIDATTGFTHSYDDVRKITLRVAATLVAHGLAPGNRASVLSPNHPAAYATVLGILRAGLTLLPLNPRNAAHDNATLLGDFGCDILFYLSSNADILPNLAACAPNLRHIICLDQLEHWMADAGSEVPDLPHDPQRPYVIQPTGGTTGRAKGVMMVNYNLESVVASFLAAMPCATRPVFLAAAPLTHAAGMVMQSILAQGGAGVMMGKINAAELLSAIPRHRITHIFLPPTVIYDLLSHPSLRAHDYSSLKYFMYGASPIAPEKLREAIAAFGPVMTQVYGQTESGLPNLYLSPAEHFDANGEIATARLTSCGRPLPFSRVAIMDEAGRLLPQGEIGEIVIRGMGVMIGYYNNPQATAEAAAHGWHHTGDLAFRDAEGYFHIVDRKRDMVISGGFNIYSAEVERAILAHPAVQECAVIGIPDPKWGEALKAFVELRPDAVATPEELLAACRTRIGGMKTPKSLDIIDRIPRSPTGKILKRELRAPFWSNQPRLVS